MLSVVARFRMQPGKEEEALERLSRMAQAVEANEPGTLAYLIHRSQQEPSEIVVLEGYADPDALRAHARSPHMAEFQASFAQLFDASQVKVEQLERLGGFVRPEAG